MMHNTKKDEFIHLTLSTRRIFHIYADSSVDEMTDYKDLYFAQWGSGTLLKWKDKFFLLTALHVLEEHFDEDKRQNTSPFRITHHSGISFRSVDDFIYPKSAWLIGKIIKEHDYYDFEDVVLVELFHPSSTQIVDHCLDLNASIQILRQEEFADGIVLVDIGFSEKSNPYFWESDNDRLPFDGNRHTCSTIIKRDLITGRMQHNQFTHFFEKVKYIGEDTNGMSGGLIIAVLPDEGPKIVGMHARGKSESNQINFYPFDFILEAIYRYEEAEMVEIDYCHYNRLRSGENLLSLGEMFFNYAAKADPNTLRSQETDPDALANDMADYYVANKAMLLEMAYETDKAQGNTICSDDVKFFIKGMENYVQIRDKKGED